LNRGKQKTDQCADDGDDDQKLDECEAPRRGVTGPMGSEHGASNGKRERDEERTILTGFQQRCLIKVP
jgi:hypothetical protein